MKKFQKIIVVVRGNVPAHTTDADVAKTFARNYGGVLVGENKVQYLRPIMQSPHFLDPVSVGDEWVLWEKGGDIRSYVGRVIVIAADEPALRSPPNP